MKKTIFLRMALFLVCIGMVLFFLYIRGTVKSLNKNGNSFISPTITADQKKVTEDNAQTDTEQNIAQIFLSITEPQNNSSVNSSTIIVAGKTVANAAVFINDKELKADAAGSFSTNITLDEGENIILVVANDEYGNYSEKEVMVNLETLN